MPPIHVLGFAPPPPLPAQAAEASGERYDFLYVADGEAHKNHRRLVEAWALLARQGVKPSLALTLSERDAALRHWVHEQVLAHGLRIHLLPAMGHAQVLALYRRCGALVFPSLGESYGLPLIEARQAHLPIVAGELDFVRDVCTPTQTFDPSSPISIARAVLRQMGQVEEPAEPVDAGAFLRALLVS